MVELDFIVVNIQIQVHYLPLDLQKYFLLVAYQNHYYLKNLKDVCRKSHSYPTIEKKKKN